MKKSSVKYGPPIIAITKKVRMDEKLLAILAAIRVTQIDIGSPCPLCGCNTKHRKVAL